MKILFPVHGLGTGVGSEDYMLGVARGLRARGHQVTLVAPAGSQIPDWDPAAVVFCGKTPDPVPILWRAWYPISVAYQIFANASLKAPDHDVVVTGLLPALFGRRLRSGKTPRVYLPPSPIAWFEILSYGRQTLGLRAGALAYHWLQSWAWKSSDAVCSFTPELTATRAGWFKSRPRRLIESPPGIDFGSFEPGPRQVGLLGEFGIPGDAPLIISFCRLIASKDVSFLLRAFAKPEIPREAHLLVLGRGPESDNLQQLARSLGVDDRVHFAGFRDRVDEYLRLGHVYAFPSRLESFGLTLAQAMATGLPAIARRRQFPEILTFSDAMIDDGVTGFLVDDEAEMAGRLALLLNDRGRRETMGREAARAMRERFRWDRHINAIESALLKVTGRG